MSHTFVFTFGAHYRFDFFLLEDACVRKFWVVLVGIVLFRCVYAGTMLKIIIWPVIVLVGMPSVIFAQKSKVIAHPVYLKFVMHYAVIIFQGPQATKLAPDKRRQSPEGL